MVESFTTSAQSTSDQRQLHWANRRVFVTPSIGCPARCRFCYLPSVGCATPAAAEHPTEVLVQKLTANARFEPGSAGTLISIGCFSESLAPHAWRSTVEFISLVAHLKNPIQIATRWILEGDDFQQFASNAFNAGVTMFHSFCSISSAHTIELGTPALERRLSFIQRCIESNIRPVLYIKPFLPGVTIESKAQFVNICTARGIRDAVVGPFYLDERIADRLSPGLRESLSVGYYGSTRLPVDLPVEDFGELHPELLDLVAALRGAGIRVYHHGTQLFGRS